MLNKVNIKYLFESVIYCTVYIYVCYTLYICSYAATGQYMITDIINFVTFGCNLQRIIMHTRTINDSDRLWMVFDSLIERLKHESESLLIVIAASSLRCENYLMTDKNNWIVWTIYISINSWLDFKEPGNAITYPIRGNSESL